MEKTKKYKKCPRCELNYIPENEDYCLVCKAEMKLTDDFNDDLELCPICGVNFVSVDQAMCDECAKKRTLDDVVDEIEPNADQEGEWEETDKPQTQSIDDLPADDDVEIVSFSELEDDEDDFDDLDDDEDDMDNAFDGEDELDEDFNIDDYDDDDDDDDDDEDDDDDDDDDDDIK